MPASRRVSIIQFEELVAWMESHPLQARATQINSTQAKQSSHILWEELTSRLNAVGDGVTKTAKEWRQYWSDQKCKVKKRLSQVRQQISEIGDGPSWDGILSPIEDRILSIIGIQNVMRNKNVQIDIDMCFDDSPSQPVPLLELPLPRPVTPDPDPTSGHSTPDIVKRENATPPHTQPSPRTAFQTRPPKRKYEVVADTDADDPEPETSRPHSTADPPRWALDLETGRIREEEMRRELEERRELEKRRLAMEEQRLAMEEQRELNERRELEERRLAMEERRLTMEEQRLEEDRMWRRDQLAMEERRLAMDERRLEEDRTWRRNLLSALQRAFDFLGQPPRPPSPFQ